MRIRAIITHPIITEYSGFQPVLDGVQTFNEQAWPYAIWLSLYKLCRILRSLEMSLSPVCKTYATGDQHDDDYSVQLGGITTDCKKTVGGKKHPRCEYEMSPRWPADIGTVIPQSTVLSDVFGPAEEWDVRKVFSFFA